MNLISEFHPKPSKGNSDALTVICMLSGYTFCIPITSKSASDVIRAYIDHVFAILGESVKVQLDNGTKFNNELFVTIAE